MIKNNTSLEPYQCSSLPSPWSSASLLSSSPTLGLRTLNEITAQGTCVITPARVQQFLARAQVTLVYTTWLTAIAFKPEVSPNNLFYIFFLKTLPDIVWYKTLAAEVESSASVVSFFTKITDFFFDSIRVDEIVMLVYMRVSESSVGIWT